MLLSRCFRRTQRKAILCRRIVARIVLTATPNSVANSAEVKPLGAKARSLSTLMLRLGALAEHRRLQYLYFLFLPGLGKRLPQCAQVNHATVHCTVLLRIFERLLMMAKLVVKDLSAKYQVPADNPDTV